jgi:hypothetical protein
MSPREALTQITLIVAAVQQLDITPTAGINGINQVLENFDKEENPA